MRWPALLFELHELDYGQVVSRPAACGFGLDASSASGASHGDHGPRPGSR